MSFRAFFHFALLPLLAPLAFAWSPGTTPYEEGRVLVRFDHGVQGPEEGMLLLDQPGIIGLKPLVPALDIWLATLAPGTTFVKTLDDLERAPGLLWAQADHLLDKRQTFPNDPLWTTQWDLHNTGQSGGTADADIDAPEAWDLGTGGLDGNGNSLVVAIVDGGMELTHANLVPNLWRNEAEIAGVTGVDDDGNGYVDDRNGWDAYGNDGGIPSDGHGTHVAGTVGARGNDASQVTGINWNVKLMAVAASSSSTSVISTGYGYVLAQKTLWLQSGGTQGANVVSTNSSFGVDLANCSSGSYPVWNDLYNAMGGVGILSAGATANANYNVDTQGDVPTSCSSPWLVTVTNTTRTDTRNSSCGYGATTIDLGAPGTNVLSTYTGNSTSTLTGTSMATPHVAGAIAFLHSVAGPGFTAAYNSDPAAGALLLKQIMLDEVDPLTALAGITVSGGRLNLNNAALVISQMGGVQLTGVVTSQTDGSPLAGATLSAQPGTTSTTTNAQGQYSLSLQEGDYTILAQAYGFVGASQTITIPGSGSPTLDFSLAAVPVSTLSGVVLGADDQPLSGALVEVAGVPLASQTTGLDGTFGFSLPAGGTYTVSSRNGAAAYTVPQAADGYGYRAFDLADADWCETEVVLGESGAQVTLQGRNRAVYDWSFIDPEQGGSGTALAFTADDQTLSVTLPVPFPYYGQSYTELSVCGNGWLGLGATTATEYRGQAIPLAEAPNAVLAAFWEDLSPQQAVSGNVSTWHDAAGGRFIVEFNNIRQFSPSSDFETFQVILLDPVIHPTVSGDGAILYQYHTIGELDNATVGIENPAGSVGLQYFYGRGNGVNTVGGTLPASNMEPTAGMALLFTTGMLVTETPLEPVTDLGISLLGNQALLTWSPVSGATQYRIETRTGLDQPWQTLATVVAPGWQVSADTGVDLFRVTAIN